MLFERIYNKGYEAGRNAGLVERMDDHTRQLAEVYAYGKMVGAEEERAKIGEIDTDDLMDVLEADI